MKTADRELLWDVLAGSSAVLAFVGFIAVGKLYHGIYGLTLEELLPLAYLLVSWLLLVACRAAGWARLGHAARLWMWLSLLVALSVHYGAVVWQAWGAAAVAAAAALVSGLGWWTSHKASEAAWAGWRRLVGFLPGLIVATPLVVGPWLDEPVLWLEAGAARAEPRTATLVLLFDEMNANASGGLQSVLRAHGLQVDFKPVRPVQGSTTEVVPAVFTGQDFEGARACGLTRVCADGAALDFAQVSVERSDVDVVGFHHPYCAMQGLRSCQRLTTSRSFLEPERWECSFRRRLGVSWSRDHQSCQEASHTAWQRMRDHVSAAVLSAPALSEGGVLYAHIPLPHPPAKGTGSLSVQYDKNLSQAAELLGQVLDRLSSNRIEPRILIFSDHPLRQASWCAREAQQFDTPCMVDPALVDYLVPLIVAARSGLPVIEHVASNQQVFDVLRAWLKE